MRPRLFRLRSKYEIGDETLDCICQGFNEWRAWVLKQIADWDRSPANQGTPVPEYVIGDVFRSEDRREVWVEICGDPRSIVAFKMVEDGVPPMMYEYVPRDRRAELEKRYDSPYYDYGGWLPLT